MTRTHVAALRFNSDCAYVVPIKFDIRAPSQNVLHAGRGGRSRIPNMPLTDPSQFDILHPVPAFGGGPNAIRSIETALVHHAARQLGSRVAAGCARAAG